MTSEVTQADRDAAEPFLKWLYGPRKAPQATTERFVQAFAAHRLAHRGGEVVAWQGIESAPMDEQILAAIKVHHKNGEIWWEQHIIVIDSETGEIRDMDFHHGWEAEDYEAWQPLPTPPQALGEQP